MVGLNSIGCSFYTHHGLAQLEFIRHDIIGYRYISHAGRTISIGGVQPAIDFYSAFIIRQPECLLQRIVRSVGGNTKNKTPPPSPAREKQTLRRAWPSPGSAIINLF